MRPRGAAPGKVTARITSDQLQLQSTRPSSGLARAGSASERIQDRLEAHGCRPVDRGSFIQALCPSHDDREASLTIYAKPGRIRIRCWAGCADVDVLAALELNVADLYDEPRAGRTTSQIDPGILRRIDARRAVTAPQRPEPRLIKVCDSIYRDENGNRLFAERRYVPKTFRLFHWNDGGEIVWGLGGVRRVLFHLPELLAAKARGERHVYLCEGAKDVEELERHGAIATTWPNGAASWRSEYAPMLAGWFVTIIADRDPAGLAASQEIARSLHGHAARVRTVRARVGKDAYDHLTAGYGLAEFEELIDSKAYRIGGGS